jgi:hypothetical protein
MSTLIPKYRANTLAELSAGGSGATPTANIGLQYTAPNSAGNNVVFAAIQSQQVSATAGSETGGFHFLTNDVNFLNVNATVLHQGNWIFSPGFGYSLNICGLQTINGVAPGSAPYPPVGGYFGERVSVEEADNQDARVLAVRNSQYINLSDLGKRVGIGFSILNGSGYERNTATFRAQYSSNTNHNENSFMYPSTLVSGVETNGPYFYNGGIGFQSTVLEANRLGAYEVGTWTPTFGGSSGGSITGTWTTGPTGSYILIGKQLFISFYGLMNSPTGYPTGQVSVSGLPFAIKNGATGNYQSVMPNYLSYGTAPTSVTTRWQSNGSTQLLLYSGTSWAASGSIELGGSGVLQLA